MLRTLFTFFKNKLFFGITFSKKTINLAFHVTNMEHSEHKKAILKPVTLF